MPVTSTLSLPRINCAFSIIVYVFLFSACSVALSAGALLVLMWVAHFFPLATALSTDVFPEWAYMLKPEREALFYRFFVFAALAIGGTGFWKLGAALGQSGGPDRLQTVLPVKSTWRNWEWLVPAGIVFFIAVPDADMVLSRVTDFFYHIDSLFAAPGWAGLKGLKLNVDITSEYSILIPTLFGHFLNSTGHFGYPGFITVMAIAGCVYFCMFYVFLRVWGHGPAAAIAGVMAGVGAQMFHPGVFPIVWQFPSATVMRFFWDIPVLLLLMAHIRSGRMVYLWGAAAFVGLSLVWMVDAGVYLFLALAAYVLMVFLYQGWRGFKFSSGLMAALLIPWGVAFLLLWTVQGPGIVHREFWRNTFEFAALFMQGWGALPICTSLNEHRYIAFITGLAIPVFYLWVLLAVGALWFFRRIAWDNIIACVLCVYGLGLYHYYVVRSGPTSYAAVCLPAVALVFWILSQISARLKPVGARWMWAGVFAAIAVYFWLNPLVRDYPGLWNPWARARQMPAWQEGMDFAEDEALIKRLTDADERVPLLSSFEVKMLIDAGRAPYFYYFPLFQSDAMHMLQFRGTYLHTRTRMRRTLAQLEKDKPEHIFVEKKLFLGAIPSVYYARFETLTILMAYLHQNYKPDAAGKYLLALRRKGSG